MGVIAVIRIIDLLLATGECAKGDNHYGIFKTGLDLVPQKIAVWQEAYMDRLNQEYIDILSGEGNPSDKFWLVEKRINQDKRRRGVVIQLRKQNLAFDLAALINDDAITFADIEEFSNETKEIVKHLCDMHL